MPSVRLVTYPGYRDVVWGYQAQQYIIDSHIIYDLWLSCEYVKFKCHLLWECQHVPEFQMAKSYDFTFDSGKLGLFLDIICTALHATFRHHIVLNRSDFNRWNSNQSRYYNLIPSTNKNKRSSHRVILTSLGKCSGLYIHPYWGMVYFPLFLIPSAPVCRWAWGLRTRW